MSLNVYGEETRLCVMERDGKSHAQTEWGVRNKSRKPWRWDYRRRLSTETPGSEMTRTRSW